MGRETFIFVKYLITFLLSMCTLRIFWHLVFRIPRVHQGQADICNSLRYLLITSSVGAYTPTETGESNPRLKKRGSSLMRLNAD